MKLADVKSGTYIDFSVEKNDEDLEYEVGGYVRISKYKNIFPKGYAQKWSEKVFVIKNVKNTISWTYVISDLSSEEIVKTSDKKELQKTDKTEFRVEKVIKRKCEKLYVK